MFKPENREHDLKLMRGIYVGIGTPYGAYQGEVMNVQPILGHKGLEDHLELDTPYGTINIPLIDIIEVGVSYASPR